MPLFGTTILSFIPGWSAEGGRFAIEKTTEYGFDMLEIILPASLDFDAKKTKKLFFIILGGGGGGLTSPPSPPIWTF